MENGVGRVDEAQLGSEKIMEKEVSGEKIMETDVVGSDESKELEEDVFEEAVDSQEQLQGQGNNSGSEGDLLAADGSGSMVVNESPEVVVDVNADVGHETETFVEAVSVPTEAGNQEELAVVDGDENVEDLVAGESIDKIDEGGTGREEPGNQLGRGNEVSETPHNWETEVNADVGQPHQGNEILPEDSKRGKAVEEGSDIQDVNTVELVNAVDELPEGEGKLLDSNHSTMVTSHQDEKSKELELKGDSLGVEFMNGADEAKLLTDVHASVNIQRSAKNTKDLDDTSDTQHLAESTAISSGDSLGVEFMNGADEAKLLTDVHASVNIQRSAKNTKDLDDTSDTQHLAESTAISSGVQTALENVSSTPEALSSSSADKPANGRNEEVLADTTNGRAEDDKGFEPQHATVKVNDDGFEPQHSAGKGNDNGFEPQRSVGKVNGAERNNFVKEDPEKKEENNQEEKQATDREPAPHVSQQGAKVASSSGRSLGPDPEEKEENDREDKQATDKEHATHVSQQGTKLASSSGRSSGPAPPTARPAGLGRAAPLLEPAPRAVQQPRVNGALSHMQSQQIEDPNNGESEEFDETRERLQMIRVKFLRLAHRLGQTPHNVVVAQVLYRLGLAEQLRGRNGGRVGAFSFDRASAMAEQREAAGQDPLDFSCTIMVLGKTGVGKSATINSIFDEVKFNTDAFQLGTKKVQDVVGTVQGIKVRVIDTPGLLASWSDQRQNEKILHSVKRFIKKTPPDIVLYLDRLDVQSRDFGDMPLLRTITETFGPSIWFNAIVVLTHAASAPPDGPNGTASSYDMFVTQRSHSVQHAIRQAAGDMRLMNPVSLVENHSACRTNRAGQRVLPNGQVWKPHLLLLSFASKILAEANTLLQLQDSPPGKPYAPRSRAPPLPFLLSSLLQSRSQVKLPDEQFDDEDDFDDDLDESSDSEDDSGYDDLPPFKSLSKSQVEKLTKAQKKAYFDELEYREKLFMKKQLKEEKKRRKMMKKLAEATKDLPSDPTESAEEVGGAASVPVPLPDLALPASFDSDNPTHRYRYLDTSSQWLVRPVLDSQGWDHDVGYEGINVERLFVVKEKIPLSLSGQISKDKRDANVQMELASSLKHGKGKATLLGFDMQTVGKDLAYTFRSETKFSNFRKNKAAAGLSVTLLGDALSAGVKVEDKLILHKRFQMVMSGGAMTGRGDVAYGGSLEAQLRDKDYPLGQSLSTLGLSVMDWHGDLAIGCNIQSQVPIGRSTNLIGRANWNNRGSGQISIRVNSSEQLQIALIGLIPLLRKLLDYPQHMQFGQ